jgi:RHS repeat-associated protein
VTFCSGNGVPYTVNASIADQDYTYTGRQWDAELGVYYYRARHYGQYSGTFLSRDPIRDRVLLNGYSYVGQMPVDAVDPFGLQLSKAPQPVKDFVANAISDIGAALGQDVANAITNDLGDRVEDFPTQQSDWEAKGWDGYATTGLGGDKIYIDMSAVLRWMGKNSICDLIQTLIHEYYHVNETGIWGIQHHEVITIDCCIKNATV